MKRRHGELKKMKQRKKIAEQTGLHNTEGGRYRKRTPLGCPKGKRCGLCNWGRRIWNGPTGQERSNTLEEQINYLTEDKDD